MGRCARGLDGTQTPLPERRANISSQPTDSHGTFISRPPLIRADTTVTRPAIADIQNACRKVGGV